MRRRILLTFILLIGLLLCLSIGLWGYIATHQEQIGAMISSRLSDNLKTPVTLKKARLGFHPRPTLDFTEITIEANHRFKATIPQLHVRVSWRDLLQGQLAHSHITVVDPQIYLLPHTLQAPSDATPSSGTPFDWRKAHLPQLHITIERGEIHLAAPHGDTPQFWQISELAAKLTPSGKTGLSFQGSGNLHLPDGSIATIFSRIELSGMTHELGLATVQAQGKVSNMTLPASLQKAWPFQIDGRLNIQSDWRGNFHDGLRLQATVKPTAAPLQLRHANAPTIQVNQCTLSCRLQQTDELFTFDEATLSLNKMKLSGQGFWSSDLSHYGITANSNAIMLEDLYSWLPAKLSRNIVSIAPQGRLTLKTLKLDSQQWPPTLSEIQAIHLDTNLTRLNLGSWSQGPVNVTLDGSAQALYLTSTPLRLAATAGHIAWPLDIKLSQRDKQQWQLHANLKQMTYNAARVVAKKADNDGQLSCTFESNPHGWQLSSGTLTLPHIGVDFSGTFRSADSYQLQVNIPELELAHLGPNIQLLKQMNLRGKIAVEETLTQTPGQPLDAQGTLTLTDCAISPTHVIAPIHTINGQARLSGKSLDATDLKVGLGDSQLRVNAHLDDITHPVAQIHARATDIFAKDLVFNSPTARLHDLDGRIAIHAHGIDFTRATVRLDQGTTATVTGTLKFHGPDLQLLVEAPFANVDEVIALWHGSANHGHTGQWPHHEITDDEQETLHIRAMVDKGIISGFEFSDATGTIHYRYGRLRIEPLLFEADAGYGSGRVLLYQTTDPATLQIEGTVVNIDADKVYSQLLKHTGLVTGRLTGDFSISGPIGSTFLPNSNGLFSVTIQDGVLRKFKVLSKAFSLLNVAQLFTFSLPDMAKEGMPFSRLTSDVILEDGVLRSENLRIDSAAMNTVLAGELDLVNNDLDLIMGIKPLGTVDTVFTRIPVAGWLLTGDDRAVLSANFEIKGSFSDPKVEMMPLTSLSNKVFGIFKRTLTLPGTLIKDPEKVLTNPDRPQK